MFYDINELYDIYDKGEMKTLIENSSLDNLRETIGIVWEQNLIGTMVGDDRSSLADYGIDADHIKSLLGEDAYFELYDEIIAKCPVCGWYCPAGEPCCDEEDDDEE